jgi:integrase
VKQVFELAGRVGVRPVGNVRKLDSGEYRLRYRTVDGTMRRFPGTFPSRAAALRMLWDLAEDGRADSTRDDRFRELVLLAAFASLRWGEVTVLRHCDIDIAAGAVRVRFAYTEQDNGKMLLGPPKSRAGRRTVGIPAGIIPDLAAHLAKYTKHDDNALVFTGIKGGPLRRSGLQQTDPLGRRRTHHGRTRPALPRSSAHRQHARRRHGCLSSEPDGPHGT